IVRCGPDLGLRASELGDGQAERQPHARRLGAQPDGDLPASRLSGYLEAAEARHGLDRVAHGIGAKLGPALAPEIVGGLGAVDDGEHLRQRLDPWRHLPVVLAGAEYVVPRAAALFGAPLDVAGLPESDRDLGHD